MGGYEFLIISVLKRTLVAGTPLLLGTLGEIYAERSGVLNLGVEGLMAIGAVSGFGVALVTGNPWLGLLAAAVFGAILSLVHAFVSVTLKSNQIISGLALTMLGLGISGLWGKAYIGIPLTTKFESVKIPILSKIPYVGEILFHQDPIFYISVIAGIVMWFILFKTEVGINIRSVGENPLAADAMGVNVYKTRYVCVIIGGVLAGVAGAHLSLAYIPSWIEGMTGGRGWIVIALTIFALWNPLRAMLGAYLFGGIYVLQYLLQPIGIPPNILLMFPYLATLFVLLVSAQETFRKRMGAPRSLGVPYDKEEK